MRDHEIELISALVEGRLKDDSEARSLIASSAELQEEYESQKRAYQALAAAGPAAMREDEKAALHRDVWTALRADTRRSKTPWYYKWVPVTAGLFIVAIAVVNLGGPNESAETFQAIGAGLESVPTTAAATATTATAEMAADAGEDAAEEMAPRDLTQGNARLFADAAEALRREGSDGALDEQASSEPEIDIDECLATAGVEDHDVIGTIDSTFLAEVSDVAIPYDEAQTFIVAVPTGADLETAPITFVDTETCQEVHVDG